MKNKKLIKNLEIAGVGFGIIFGTMLHFMYVWSGYSNIVATFAVVNESVWEHTKLFFFPMLIFMFVELYLIKDKKRVLLAKVLEAFFGIAFTVGFFYTYTGIFGVDLVWVDIAYFMVTVAMAKYLSYRVLTSKYEFSGYKSLHIAVLALITIFYGVATFIPPHIPLFRDSEKGIYGPVK